MRREVPPIAASPEASRPAGRAAGILVAVQYLTVLPVPRRGTPGDLGRAAPWFPVVGLVLGALLALAAAGADLVLAPAVAGALLVALWVALTGALHLDGLADACDGLGGAFGRDRALAIMRDPRTGPYGVAGVVLVLLVKAAVLASLSERALWRALLVALTLGRLAPVLLARLLPPARPDGAGRAFADGVSWGRAGIAAAIAAIASLSVLGAWGALPLGAALACVLGAGAYLRRRLGGTTGDCLGAMVEVTEALVLVLVASLDAQELV
jgi:adenosylcobinamide-GDP ribazoletransferase